MNTARGRADRWNLLLDVAQRHDTAVWEVFCRLFNDGAVVEENGEGELRLAAGTMPDYPERRQRDLKPLQDEVIQIFQLANQELKAWRSANEINAPKPSDERPDGQEHDPGEAAGSLVVLRPAEILRAGHNLEEMPEDQSDDIDSAACNVAGLRRADPKASLETVAARARRLYGVVVAPDDIVPVLAHLGLDHEDDPEKPTRRHTTIPEDLRAEVENRLEAFATATWPQVGWLDVAWHRTFAIVTAHGVPDEENGCDPYYEMPLVRLDRQDGDDLWEVFMFSFADERFHGAYDGGHLFATPEWAVHQMLESHVTAPPPPGYQAAPPEPVVMVHRFEDEGGFGED